MGNFNFKEGEYLLIDKPEGWTSFDIVNKIRIILKHEAGIPKIKVGHAGTLDPLATGLLLVCTGKFTRKIQDLSGLDKEYTGRIRLGATTPSYDKETAEENITDFSHLTEDDIEGARKKFTGVIMQVPPLYSAKKIGGKRAYEYARNREEVRIEPRPVTIHEFEITGLDLPYVDFRVRCSKGTYIRSLAHDFGHELKTGGYLDSLRRTAVGEFRVEDALTIKQFGELMKDLKRSGELPE